MTKIRKYLLHQRWMHMDHIQKIAKRRGHKKSNSVDKYVHIADSMKEQTGKCNLFNQAFRSIKKSRG